MNKNNTTILFLIFFTLFPSASSAKNWIVINEIAWMGTEESYANEWIELYNNSSSLISLEEWKLFTEDKKIEAFLEGEIEGNGFYLLERTDDQTLPEIKADLIYKGNLSNKGEFLLLENSKKEMVDSVNCSSGWFKGDNKTKTTMERIDPNKESFPENWRTSEEKGGTPKQKNSQEGIIAEKIEIKTIYPSGIFINELMPYPEGPDSENEWIEIFNSNDFEVDLFDWKLRDEIGSTKTFTFEREKIKGKGFLIVSRPTSKIILNNNGDEVTLINPNDEIVDSVAYPKALKNNSFSKIETGWIWTIPTPGAKNKQGEAKDSSVLEKTNLTEKNQPIKPNLPAEIYGFSKNIFFARRLLAGILVSFLSGLSVLFVRKKLDNAKKNN
jgi:hypothetical protein